METGQLNFTFTSRGLKYLSLKSGSGEETIDLTRECGLGNESAAAALVLRETANFLKTGKHKMVIDLAKFTDFQKSVFKKVLEIEPGEITTYGALAAAVGNPQAARAVGLAVSKNPVSYFIPTHRLLPQKGLGHCRSGAGFLREKLLAHEGHDLTALTNAPR